MNKWLRTRFDRKIEASACACAWMKQNLAQNEKQNETGCIATDKHDAARLPVTMKTRGYWKTLFLSSMLALPVTTSAVTPPGTSINNIAAATFDIGGPALVVNSNTVTVTSTIISTPSTITLYQYDPTGAGMVNLAAPTQFASSGPPGTGFVVSPDPTIPLPAVGITTLDANAPISMNPVDVYHAGEPVFILLQDLDQNLNPGVQETIIVTVTSSTGDQEELILTETGVDTGIFIGYVQSASSAVAAFNGVLSLGADDQITVNYVDQYDGTDSSVNSALVDPFGKVFKSNDGSLLDGIVVTLLDGAGNPATVYGDDGISLYPNVITTGGSVTDASGTIYNFPAGGYRFPLLVPGDYQIVLTVPAALTVPSQATIVDLQALPTAPYALDANASFGNVFNVPAGPPMHVDVPVDPKFSYLLLNKSSSKDRAAIGDYIQYTLKLDNTDTVAIANNTVITDILPNGFRYQTSSVLVNGTAAADPIVSPDARNLQFNVGTLLPGESVEVKYVTEISSATANGKAINIAVAVDDLGVASNTAQSSVKIFEDLIKSRSFIVGKVINGECGDDDRNLPGFPDARIYMEDGSYVVTDKEGLYHFEGVVPGVHVVQLDTETIPDNLEIVACEENTRFAGNVYSQFVDVKGGTMWRANFYVRQKDPIKDIASLSLESDLNNEEIKYTVNLSNGRIPVTNYRLMVILPEGVHYIAGSSSIESEQINEPEIIDNILVYRLGDMNSDWQKHLRLRARLRDKADGEIITSAMFTVDTEMKKTVRSQAVKNKLNVKRKKVENRDMVFQAHFKPMGTELTERSKKAIRLIIGDLKGAEVTLNHVVGHTDGDRVAKRSSWLFSTNDDLSMGRAQAVSNFLVRDLGVNADKVKLEGRGSREPIATNATVEGRAKNRRAELYITTKEITDPGSVVLTVPKSEVASAELIGQPVYDIDKKYNLVPQLDQSTISDYDEHWIKNAEPGTEWLMPKKDGSPVIPAVNIAVKYNPADKVELLQNGEPVNPLFNFGTITNKASTVARVYWQGIHLIKGENKFEFVVKDKDGVEKQRLTRLVTNSGSPVRAELVEEYSRLVADGNYSPVIALRLFDQNGHLVKPGAVGNYEVNAPYISKQEIDSLDNNHLTGLDRNSPRFQVGDDGIALIELEPTTATGKVIIKLPFAGNQDQEIETWLRADLREWILVGLAEGTAGYRSVTGNMQGLSETDLEDKAYTDGRIAFFAKGKVKGSWLITAAYDSEKGEYETDNRVNQLIDPDSYYTIYGDGTNQRYDASSAEKLYLKIERERFYALYGDYDSGLNVTELSKFSRRMTGFKSEMDTGLFSYTAFAAENRNKFIKDELPGDGTSGLYRFSNKDLVINSEKIIIETRDRFRSEVIIESKTLARHIDYNIDYQEGTIYFRQPILSRDSNFNPVFIVADYEVESPVKGGVTAGARAAVKLLDDVLEVGASAVHDATFAAESDLVGVDAKLAITDETKVKFEAASTDGDNAGVAVSGNAMLAEIEHNGEELQGRVYVKQQDAGFGMGQQSGSQTGTRKLGAEGRYKLTEKTSVNALAYREENLNTTAERNVTEANVAYAQEAYSLTAGARIARDTNGAGQAQDSDLLLLGATTKLFDNKLRLRANSENALSSANASTDYPSRYIVGADYLLTPEIDLFAENEWTMGEMQDTEMTRLGVRATPWQGAQLNSSLTRDTLENGERTFASMGLTQSFRISEHWTGDVALDKSKTIREPGAVPLNINVPIAQGTANDDFTAVSTGLTYQAETYTVNTRLETRNAETENKVGAIVNWERKLIDGIAYAAATHLFDTERADGSSSMDTDIRLSLGYRPNSSNWITLDRLEYKLDEENSAQGDTTRQRKLVNNLVTNYKPDHYNQLAINYGLKYVIDSFDGDEYNGTTQLLGTEYRHDFTRVVDFGVHAHTLHSGNANNFLYSTGASVGFQLARNIWLSLGYNFDGFEDRDFSAAGYTAQGPYLQFRMKFDQDTGSEISNWLN
ncbi:MAG: OmpA family protein [Gammaproteobacteria bacterium]|nr:OmpA family protein [Gammaproteobacteria bacterium]